MYHHQPQQQGLQPFSNGSRPPPHQPPSSQHQSRGPSDMLSQGMGFQFPRPTQLPEELESALAIRGARDMDHRLIDHMNQSNQHQNQGSASGITQHANYGSNAVPLSSDHQPGHQQGVDWSNYPHPTKMFANPPPNDSHQSQQHQGPQQQQPQNSHAGASIPGWTGVMSDSQPQQTRHPHGGGGDGQGLYTPESAGSILASFGLSNEDLEVLSHYPDDQLTPDTLPFILRDIQINKSGSHKTVASTPSSTASRGVCDLPSSQSLPSAHPHSTEVPSLLTVTQTAGKVIDYGHASRAKDESSSRETFKREPLSTERTVKMYPATSSSSAPKVDKAERRPLHLEHPQTSKHGDRDYRRTSGNHRKSSRSPGREFPPSSKSRNLDRDYRHDRAKPRPQSETRSEDSSRRSLSSSSDSKPIGSSKKFPTPAMISDFSAVSPKVYPHTCSLCDIQCDQEKDWVDHINTVNHTAACRDLHNKYPEWKPNLSSRTRQYGNWALWHSKDHSPSHSKSRSLSCSPPRSPPHGKHRGWPHPHKPHGRPYSPHHHPRPHHYSEHRLDRHHSGSRSPTHPYFRPERRDRESSGGSFRSTVKRPRDNASRHPSSTKHGPPQSNAKALKTATKPGAKLGRAKASEMATKPPPAKKKKKAVSQASQDWSVADRLVYLTGIPKDASEQEVTDLVGSFGKINNVILMPCSDEAEEKSEGQKASVCMMKAEDTRALANSTTLSIREQQITASLAKKPGQDKCPAGEDSGGDADQKTSEEKGLVLITGLPESGWSESDIIQLIQPFGTPSDIVMATQIGKALVSVPDAETAQEMVKVHTFMPAKIKDTKVKTIHLKQCIGLSTPVALYNLLRGSTDPFENSPPVGWSKLLVISNVPDTPSASSEVLKLVRRFGTVIKTLVLNNMVICEMATAALALSVYKRFQTFPCIIQNNPLFFSRKPDPKASTHTKVITAFLDATEDTPANGKAASVAPATVDESAPADSSELHLKETEKMGRGEGVVDENKALGEDGSKDELTNIVSDSSAAPDTTPTTDSGKNEEALVVQTPMQTADGNKDISLSEAGNEKNLTIEVRETSAVSGEMDMPELPKVTQEMVKALLVECRTRIGSQPNVTPGEQPGILEERDESKEAPEEKKEPSKSETEEELRKHESERKERLARKQKEVKERERREKEKRTWEKEEKAKRERERDDRARKERERKEELRREWERREKDRRERKRTYAEDFSGPRPFFKFHGSKYKSWREEHHRRMEEEKEKEEEEEEFPFNLSDFVTVDEVGDVTDLPSSPNVVAMETTDDGEESATSIQTDIPGDTAMEITDTTETLMKPEEQVPQSEPESLTAAASPLPASESHVETCKLEETGSDTPQTENTQEAEQLSTVASTKSLDPPEVVCGASSNTPQTGVETADNKGGMKEDAASLSQAVEEEGNKKGEADKVQDEEDREIRVPAAETGKAKECGEATKKGAELLRQRVQTHNADYVLPPFDPSVPVGMEFLVPKTGFFCKACNRFFSGSKEAEINHCKTVKHYENLQKHLQTLKTAETSAKAESLG